MNLDLSTGKISLILCPTDLRSGFNRLSAMALKYLSIDVSKGNDWVVFVSKRRNIAKIIHSVDVYRRIDKLCHDFARPCWLVSGNFHAGQKACANCVEAGGRLSHESTFAGPT